MTSRSWTTAERNGAAEARKIVSMVVETLRPDVAVLHYASEFLNHDDAVEAMPPEVRSAISRVIQNIGANLLELSDFVRSGGRATVPHPIRSLVRDAQHLASLGGETRHPESTLATLPGGAIWIASRPMVVLALTDLFLHQAALKVGPPQLSAETAGTGRVALVLAPWALPSIDPALDSAMHFAEETILECGGAVVRAVGTEGSNLRIILPGSLSE